MPDDRLDAVVLGGGVEGLFAATALATAGKQVAVLVEGADIVAACDGQCAQVDLRAAAQLDLVSHGLKFAAAPPLVGVSQEHTLVLWPVVEASQSSIAELSMRDADAYAAFGCLMNRSASARTSVHNQTITNWHLSQSGRDEGAAEPVYLCAAPLARILDEEFHSPLLKGLLAQGALLGSGSSHAGPGSAQLLMRQSVLAYFGELASCRHVAGGSRQLVSVLLKSLKFLNNADVSIGQAVREINFERDVVSGITLASGSRIKTQSVISTLGHGETSELIRGSARVSHSPSAYQPPAQILYATKAPPTFRGVNGALVTSGAIIRLNPSLERLARAHGAFRARQLIQDYCLDVQVIPVRDEDGTHRWDVIATVLFVPSVTDEGPWSGNRRERFVSAVTKSIDAWATGFEQSVVSATLVRPVEARSVLEAGVQVPLEQQVRRDAYGVPDVGFDGTFEIAKGLWTLGHSLSAGAGAAGLKVAQSLLSTGRTRGSADA